MERIESVNPARLAWCLADRGLSLETCAADVGIAAGKLESVLAGDPVLTFKQLRKLADYFGRGVLFFLEPNAVVDADVHTPQFRTLANQKPELSGKLRALIERVERQRDVFLSLRDEVDGEAMPRFRAPDLQGLDVRAAATTVRTWLGLGDRNDFDSYRQSIEARGILVFQSNGYVGKWQIAKESPILGFAVYTPECPVIVVRKCRENSRQSFTLMHELAHVLLDRASSVDDESDMHARLGHEQRANAFAGLLLVPTRLLAEISDADKPAEASDYDQWLSAHRKKWGVSTEVILRRLLDERRLSTDEYGAYRQWSARIERVEDDAGGSREYRNREPKHIFGEPFVRTVLEALGTRKITLSKASSYLDDLKIKDLHSLERHCAGG